MPKRIIIFGQGRSGTTLVQRVLNTIPNSYIAGENNNFWYHIWNAYKAWEYIPTWEIKLAEKAGQEPFSYDTKTDAYKPCWWNKHHDFYQTYFTSECIENFDYFYGHCDIYGFKEIRFPENEKDFNAYLDWSRSLFPDIIFIFTIREINSLVKSGWWTEKDRAKLLNQEALLRSRKDAFLMQYGKWDWEGLFNYIGEPYNGTEVERILDKKL